MDHSFLNSAFILPCLIAYARCFVSPPGSLCRLWLRPRFCHHHRPLCHAQRGEFQTPPPPSAKQLWESRTCGVHTLVILQRALTSETLTPFRQVGFMLTNVTFDFGSVRSHGRTQADQPREGLAQYLCPVLRRFFIIMPYDSAVLSVWSEASLRSLPRCCME